MNASIKSNLANLNDVLGEYQRLRKMTNQDVLEKQGGKLARNLRGTLKSIVRPKGYITAENLARLRAGHMIKIRDSVKEMVATRRAKNRLTKAGNVRVFKLNVHQEEVRRELATREMGRGVLSYSSRYPAVAHDGQMSIARTGQLLSKFGISPDVASATFLWPGISETSQTVAKGLNDPKPEAEVLNAIEKTRADIMVYVNGKYSAAIQAALRKAIRP